MAVGTLQIGDVKVEQGQVVVPIIMGGDLDSGVSSLNFRLTYNPEFFTPVSATAGTAAAGAQKQVMASANAGEYSIVMMGMNQTVCGAGEVARVVLRRAQPGDAGNWGLGIAAPCMASSDGKVIESVALPYAGPTPEEPADEDPDQEETPNPNTGRRPDSRDDQGADQPREDEDQTPAVTTTRTVPPVSAQAEGPALGAALRNVDRARKGIVTPGVNVDETSTSSEQSIDPGAGTESADTATQPEGSPKQPINAVASARKIENVTTQSALHGEGTARAAENSLSGDVKAAPAKAKALMAIAAIALAIVAIAAMAIAIARRRRLVAKSFPRREDA